MADKATDPAAGDAVVTPADGTTPSTETTKTTSTTENESVEARDATDPAIEDQDGETRTETEGEGEGKDKEKKNRVPAAERIRQVTARRRLAERERDTAIRRADAEARRADTMEQELQRLRRANPEEMTYDQREQHRLETTLLQRDVRQARSEERIAGDDARLNRNTAFVAACEEAEASGRIPDLLDKFSKVTVTEPMAEFVGRSDVGPELAYALTLPENARALADMVALTDQQNRPTLADLREADRIMARIEAKLERASAKTRKATTAAHPGTTLNGGSPPAGSTLRELAQKEQPLDYIAKRKATWAKGGY